MAQTPRERYLRHLDIVRRYQARHRAAGLCLYCPRPAREGRRSCARCAARAQEARRRGRMTACRHCGRRVHTMAKVRPRRVHEACGRQAIRRARLRWSRTANGKAANLRSSLSYQRRHIAAGLCVQCPRPAAPDRRHCARCLIRKTARYEEARGRT